jgi:hypothetical protein
MKFTTLFNEAVAEPPVAGGTGGAAVANAPAAPVSTSAPVETAWDSKLPDNWHLKLGDEYAAYAETAKNFKDVRDLVKSVVTLRGSGPKYPGEQSTPEEISRFREVAQVPADAKGYGLAAPEKLPEGVSWDQATADRLSEVAHKHHIPAPALKALAAAQLEIEAGRATAMVDAQAKQMKAAQDSLVEAWRGDFDANASTVRHFTGRLAEQAGVAPEDAARLANDPSFAKIALAMAKTTSEHGIKTPAAGDLRTPRQRADEIMKGTDAQWSEAYKKGDHAAMEVVSNLLKEAAK